MERSSEEEVKRVLATSLHWRQTIDHVEVAQGCIQEFKKRGGIRPRPKPHPPYTCNWASEASPTLGCSIEISRDILLYIYMHICRYVSYVKLTA